jgi:hypothetical protein
MRINFVKVGYTAAAIRECASARRLAERQRAAAQSTSPQKKHRDAAVF